MRRAQPWLGTLVEVAVRDSEALETEHVNTAVDAAFSAIATVHRLMSFHSDSSDVSRINSAEPGQIIAIDPWTWAVLDAASRVSLASEGLFDVTVAPLLVKAGLLPAQSSAAPQFATHRCLQLLPNCKLQLQAPVWIDLGGIAKGFAVDQAVQALMNAGIKAGAVNAGGDLRVFGSQSEPLHVRHPQSPERLLPIATLTQCAAATSAGYPHKDEAASKAGVHAHPLHGVLELHRCSVTVIAPTCMVADALTKVVLASRNPHHHALAQFEASALWLNVLDD